MILKIVSFLFLFTSVHGSSHCSHQNAVSYFKRPTYDFCVKFLDRVAQQTRFDFVFSPLSTWLQLMSLAEGARGQTEKEVWRVTRHHRMKCFRQKFREVLNSMDQELNFMTKRTNFIIVDKLLDVKESFKKDLKKTKSTMVYSLNFNEPELAAETINKAIDIDMDDIDSQFDASDFNFTVLLTADTAKFKSDWTIPFDPLFTSKEKFHSEDQAEIGKVRMMHQEAFLNLTTVPPINATVLELPFNTKGRVSMLVFLPTRGSVFDLFYNLKGIRLGTIFNLFKKQGPKFVKVELPRFKITTELRNIPELVYDMGVKRMFYPETAQFEGITKYPVYASLMYQVADIEVTEKGSQARTAPHPLTQKPKNSIPFRANRPFAFLIVDKLTETILFGGMYRHPTIF